MPVVAALRIAPVKALATVLRDRIGLDRAGVADDRRVFLLDGQGAVVTQRSHPQLATVVPDLDLDGGTLTVTLAGGVTATSSLTAGDQLQGRLFGKDRSGREIRGDVASALSDVAREPVRVVLGEPGVGWDEGPVSLLGWASARAVGGPGSEPDRYRMLVELQDTNPFEEDSWVGRDVQLGDAVVRVSHRLERCMVINHSPATGAKDFDGLRTLAGLRGPDLLCLGVIAEVVTPGDVTVGSPVSVVAAAE